VRFEILCELWKILNSIRHVAHVFLQSLDREVRWRPDGLACWKSLLELLVSTEEANTSSNEITDHVTGVCVMNGFHESLNSNIDHKSSLIFIIDAEKKSFNVELSSISLEESLGDLGKVLFLNVHLGLLSKMNLGSGSSNLLSKSEKILLFPVGGGILELIRDLNMVLGKHSSEVSLLRSWLSELLRNFVELILLGKTAISDGFFNLLYEICGILDGIWVVLGLEVIVEFGGISIHSLSIYDA